MDCETCNDLLMDLLYDELDEVRAASARKHLDGCASCMTAWQRVSQGRALASTLAPVTAPLPTAAVLAAVEAAAKANAERASIAPADRDSGRAQGGGAEPKVAPVIPLDQAPRRLPTWLHRLGDLAMRREFAMAAVALMAIGVTVRFVPWHTPSSIEAPTESAAPQVIPAQELPPEQSVTAPPLGAAQAPGRMRAMNRGATAMPRAARVEARPAPNAEASPRIAQPIAPAAGDGLRELEVQRQVSLRSTSGTPGAPSDTRYRRSDEGTPERFNAPSAVAAADRDLGRALPAAPQPAAPAWRTAFVAGQDHRDRGNTDAAIASYRAALEGNPPDAERTRIANELIGQLGRAGRLREVEEVRATYLRTARDSAGQVDEAQADAPTSSVPHVPSSVPHPSVQRPARRAMPSATNIQAY